jgi:hypothetical protein
VRTRRLLPAASLAALIIYSFSALASDPIQFSPAASYTLSTSLLRMTTGDFNKDGWPDLVVVHDNTKYSVLMNNSAGGFTSATYTVTGGQLKDVAVVELAGDTIPDLMMSDYLGFVRVFTGAGDGTFTLSASIPITANRAQGIAAGDFNGDGYPDAAVCMFTLKKVGVLLGTSGGSLGAPAYLSTGTCDDLAVGLVNADGYQDLVTANWSSDSISVLLGNGDGTFATATNIPCGNDNTDVALADINHDGLLDAVVASYANKTAVIMLGDGAGGFTLSQALSVVTGPQQVRIADFNQDGFLDIATANASAAPGMALLQATGYNTFMAAATFHADQLANGIAIADFNHDTGPDVATSHPGNSTVQVLKNYCLDTDGDGMRDWWEYQYACVNPLVGDSAFDADSDGLRNIQEYAHQTNPCVTDTDGDGLSDGDEVNTYLTDPTKADTDGDGMPDNYEVLHACLNPVVADGALDFDSDTATNLYEYQHTTDPCVFNDTDSDGMPDAWEIQYASCGLDPNVNDAGLDPDADSLTNLQEYQAHTNPCVVNDADGDGMPDYYEALHACLNPALNDAGADPDGDLRTNLYEYQHATDPCVFNDADSDGMPDWWENQYACLNPLVGDSTLDADSDGLRNIQEYNLHTNPCVADTDGDGRSDGTDCSPLDPAIWSDCGSCVDNDGDSYGANCDRGPDCDDANPNTWDTCATCHDNDGDGRYELCNRYFDPQIKVGAGTGNWSFPLYTNYHDARTQVIYLASEIGQAGTITALALDVTSIPGQVMNNFTIRMKPTSLNSYSTYAWEGPASGWVTVYQNNEPRGATGWRTFTLTTPFVYNGTDNLMVDFSFNNSSYTSSGASRATDTGANRSLYYYTDSGYGNNPLNWSGTTNPAPLVSTTIPNLRFAFDLPSVLGPDCNDTNVNTWDTCDTCVDEDWDGWYKLCNQYIGINGPDCDDDFWWTNGSLCHNTCINLYRDMDFDGHGSGPAVMQGCGIGGICNISTDNIDCDDNNYWAWDTCATCRDGDGDGAYGICNIPRNPQGQDWCDMNPNAWTYFGCNFCRDQDGDSWFHGCDRYFTVNGPDCNDADPLINPGTAEILCDSIDQNCNGMGDDNADADGDGLDACLENVIGTSDGNWDSDGDRLPDGFEYENRANPAGAMDPTDPVDAGLDFDGDGNSNANEYWNGSDPWTKDPVPGVFANPGCFYWGDADGDGVPAPSDLVMLKLEIAGVAQAYRDILPHGTDTLDLDRDGHAAPSDEVLLKLMVAGSEQPGGYPSQALALEAVAAPSGSVAVGSTTHVTLSVHSVSGTVPYAPGYGVVFTVASGNAVLLGGDGIADGEPAGNRYDVSMEAASGAKANMVVLVTGPGSITIGAKIPACGVYPIGRWNDEVVLSPAVVINP